MYAVAVVVLNVLSFASLAYVANRKGYHAMAALLASAQGSEPVIIAPGEKVFGALLAIAGVGIILTGHWATTDDMIADLIAGLLMLGFGVTILLMWSFQR